MRTLLFIEFAYLDKVLYKVKLNPSSRCEHCIISMLNDYPMQMQDDILEYWSPTWVIFCKITLQSAN